MYCKTLKKIGQTEKANKVLFMNPRRPTCMVNTPNMGLAILASILKLRGHEVFTVDYQLIHNALPIAYFVKKFNPDIIGISILTANTIQAEELINEIRKIKENIPILVGGAHITLYPEHFQENKKVDYVVIGEAESVIIELVEKAKRQNKPKIIQSRPIIDLDSLPYPDYKSFYKWEYIRSYPIMTSRGCPYRCSFCPVANISQKKWRSRNPENCINELEVAKKELNPYLHILIQDDNPLVVPERFYKFLELYSKKIKMRLSVTNIRADNVNDKLLSLLKKAGCSSVGVGVESANPEVFELINKGETFETIEKAAELIKKHKMFLSFCFIIGLPKDNLEKIEESIKFANKYKPDTIYWNMVVPYKNTAIRRWFKKHGKIYNEFGKTSLVDGDFRCEEPCAETPDFTLKEREKAHYICLFRTVDDRLEINKIQEILNEAINHNLLKDFFCWLPKGIFKSIRRKFELLGKFKKYYEREGFTEAIKRGVFLMKQKK